MNLKFKINEVLKKFLNENKNINKVKILNGSTILYIN